MEDTKICPYCGEEIKAVAKKCRFCGQWLNEDTNEVATKGEEVKPQDVAPVEQVAPKEEIEEDKATDTFVASKPDSETSNKGNADSKKSAVYWVAGILAAALLIGVGFLLGNKNSDSSAEPQQTTVEETDPETLIRKQVEAIYADVFSSPDANCESRYLTSEFYNLYVKARDMTPDGATIWKKHIWLQGEEWREMSVNITQVDLTFFPSNKASARVDLTDNNGRSIKNVTLYLEDVKGNCRIREISYNFESNGVKKRLEEYVGQNALQEDIADDSDVFKEVSRKYTVIGKDDEHVYYLKGSKRRFEPYIYYQSLSNGGEFAVDFNTYYEGTMQINDYAYRNGKITVIVEETDRNSTGFLVATLVVTYDPKHYSGRELTGGGCVKAEFSGSKDKVTLTYGEITNPDADFTYEYKYKYSTKTISL